MNVTWAGLEPERRMSGYLVAFEDLILIRIVKLLSMLIPLACVGIFLYIKYSASLRGWDAVKLNTKEIFSYFLGSQCNFS
jgi:hypothetical protein